MIPSTANRDSRLAEHWEESIRSGVLNTGPEWLQSIRAGAAKSFLQHGLPGNKDENWKYTSLRRLENLEPEIGQSGPGSMLSMPVSLLPPSQAFGFQFKQGCTNFPDQELPEGVTLLTLNQALASFDQDRLARLRGLLESLEFNGRADAFEALNTALLDDGVVIHVAEHVDAGICLAQWNQDQSVPSRLDNCRVIVMLESGSRLVLQEEFPGGESANEDHTGQALNLVYQVDLAEGSTLEHLRLQSGSDEQVLFTFNDVLQAAGSSYTYTGFELGGGLVRHDISCQLQGQGARAEVNGAFVLDHDRHVDHHICVDHQAPACFSDQFFRGVLGGRSRGVFNGKAIIRAGADGSKVRQSNANLLLSDQAEIDTKPELEIYADEVEASHGATVGQLDELAVFYLRTRGLTESQARRMLTAAFCRTVTARLNNTGLAEHIAGLLDAAMPASGTAEKGDRE